MANHPNRGREAQITQLRTAKPYLHTLAQAESRARKMTGLGFLGVRVEHKPADNSRVGMTQEHWRVFFDAAPTI